MQFQNEFLNRYLQYVENTESPRIFHIWAALSGIGAALGRRNFFRFGVGDIYPNQFVLLVGPPAVKKSTAISGVAKLLRESTGIRFAPDDTAGQRQGLATAMQRNSDENEKVLADLVKLHDQSAHGLKGHDVNLMNGYSIEELNMDARPQEVDLRDQHSVYALAPEFNAFIGHNNFDMLTFLIKMFDGDDYVYRLKSSEIRLNKPLLSILGGTTPTAIAEALPAASIGQGFMSRIILVQASHKFQSVPRPSLDLSIREGLLSTFSTIYHSFDGAFEESNDARRKLDSLYGEPVEISDPRFIYYCDRRHIHLIKLSMCLAAARLSRMIELQDVEEAHIILTTTEVNMPDALGEFGLSPLAHAKQRLIEFLTAANEPITFNTLWIVMQRDMKRSDFVQLVNDLQNSNKIKHIDTNDGPAFIAVGQPGKKSDLDKMLDDLTGPRNELDEAEVT